MSTEQKCPSCGSSNLEPGSIHSTGGLYFRPENTKFMTLATADVRIAGQICMDCGYVMLIGDLEKAGKVLHKEEAE